MDVIVDDGLHTAGAQQATLVNLWPTLRAGGLYFIEDIPTGANSKGTYSGKVGVSGLAALVDDSQMHVAMKTILHQNDVFFADVREPSIIAGALWCALDVCSDALCLACPTADVGWPPIL